jgi:aryl-alcohol dehydrogenase-like predicted oxidoreductase
MEYRTIGRSGLQVSVAGLGCNNFGPRLDAAGTKVIVEKALDLGITYFDTADAYGKGLSEEYLGAALKPHRRDVVIATKTFYPMKPGPYWSGTSRKYLMESLEDGLRRLDTDYIDLYIMHRYDPKTPIEETLRTLDDMVSSGKVRYIGTSGHTAAQVVEAEWAARAGNRERYIAAMAEYSLIVREPKQELIPICERYGIGFIPYFPLASGFLTGKYRPGQPGPAGSRLSESNPSSQSILTDANFALLGKLEAFCRESGHTLLEVAIGWLAAQSAVPSVIAGATRPEQVEENVAASNVRLSADEMAAIDAILTGTPG